MEKKFKVVKRIRRVYYVNANSQLAADNIVRDGISQGVLEPDKEEEVGTTVYPVKHD